MNQMHAIDKTDVLHRLLSRRQSGFSVDDRLIKEIHEPGDLFLITLNSQKQFLNLVWQSTSATRPLTPIGSSRTLADCACRLEKFNWSFSELQRNGYSWFERCISLDAAFDFAKFDWIALVPMNQHERQENPLGNYYIFDGVHKTIVLAKNCFGEKSNIGHLNAYC